MNRTRRFKIFSSIAMASLPAMALAHAAGEGHAHGFAAGLAHPFTGWDHWLSFALIGVLAWRVGRARLADNVVGARAALLPASATALLFILAMLGGFTAASRFMGLPYAEFGIAGLMVAIGFVLVLMAKPSLWVGAVIALLLGYVHGYVHGIELAGDWPAAGGMLCASGLLVAAGIASALVLQRRPVSSRHVQQALGVIAAMLGVSLLAR